MKRYETLDALRGVAALAVVIFHLRAFNLAPDIAPHAYLAVDFFFILSGFVVAHAYGDALNDQMPWREFARRRLVRLMPLAVLGAAFGFVVVLLKWKMAPGREDPLVNIVLSGLLNLFMLPSFFAGNAYEHGMYPGDGPLWSLFFELLVNLVWGWVGARLSRRQLAAVVAVSAICLTVLSLLHGSMRMGVGPQTFFGGLARASFGFSLGVLLYRLRDRFPGPKRSWGAAVCVLSLLIAFCAPLLVVYGKPQALAWDLVWIFAIFPGVVVLGAAHEGAGRVSRLLGALSYPVYVLHWPCLAILSGVRQKLAPSFDPLLFCGLAILVVVVLAWLTLRFYDEPVRRRLGRLASVSRKTRFA